MKHIDSFKYKVHDDNGCARHLAVYLHRDSIKFILVELKTNKTFFHVHKRSLLENKLDLFYTQIKQKTRANEALIEKPEGVYKLTYLFGKPSKLKEISFEFKTREQHNEEQILKMQKNRFSERFRAIEKLCCSSDPLLNPMDKADSTAAAHLKVAKSQAVYECLIEKKNQLQKERREIDQDILRIASNRFFNEDEIKNEIEFEKRLKSTLKMKDQLIANFDRECNRITSSNRISNLETYINGKKDNIFAKRGESLNRPNNKQIERPQ